MYISLPVLLLPVWKEPNLVSAFMGLSPTVAGRVGLGEPPSESLLLEQDAAMRENARSASAATPPRTSECCFRELFHEFLLK